MGARLRVVHALPVDCNVVEVVPGTRVRYAGMLGAGCSTCVWFRCSQQCWGSSHSPGSRHGMLVSPSTPDALRSHPTGSRQPCATHWIASSSTIYDQPYCLSPPTNELMTTLQFQPFQSQPTPEFWAALTALKLDKLGLNDSVLPIHAIVDEGRLIAAPTQHQLSQDAPQQVRQHSVHGGVLLPATAFEPHATT